MRRSRLLPTFSFPIAGSGILAWSRHWARNQSITVSYVGAAGRRLLQEQRRNVSRLNAEFGDVSYFPSGLTSSFQSLQTKFQRSLSPWDRGAGVLHVGALFRLRFD